MEDKISILIVEDEGIVALGLEDALETEGYRVAGTADSGPGALEIMKKEAVDLALLDIQIKGHWDGIQTAAALTEVRSIPVIFLTAFTDEATVNRAKMTAPAAFLSKPYQPRDLLIAIELALHNFAYRRRPVPGPRFPADGPLPQGGGQKESLLLFNDTVFIKQQYRFVKVHLKDIQFIEAQGNHTRIVAGDRKYLVRYSLNMVLERLAQPALVRVHRSFAVNLEQLETFNDTGIMVASHEIPLGRHYKDGFFSHFDFL